jgi:hypothetical protein
MLKASVPNPPTIRQTLRSGRQVDVVWQGVHKTDEPTWAIEYRTRIPMKGTRNMREIHREALGLWKELREEAERAGVDKASLWPVSFDHELRFDGLRPVVLGRTSTAFAFARKPDGTWSQISGWEER